jgi:hypothetical protein
MQSRFACCLLKLARQRVHTYRGAVGSHLGSCVGEKGIWNLSLTPRTTSDMARSHNCISFRNRTLLCAIIVSIIYVVFGTFTKEEASS